MVVVVVVDKKGKSVHPNRNRTEKLTFVFYFLHLLVSPSPHASIPLQQGVGDIPRSETVHPPCHPSFLIPDSFTHPSTHRPPSLSPFCWVGCCAAAEGNSKRRRRRMSVPRRNTVPYRPGGWWPSERPLRRASEKPDPISPFLSTSLLFVAFFLSFFLCAFVFAGSLLCSVLVDALVPQTHPRFGNFLFHLNRPRSIYWLDVDFGTEKLPPPCRTWHSKKTFLTGEVFGLWVLGLGMRNLQLFLCPFLTSHRAKPSSTHVLWEWNALFLLSSLFLFF